MLLAFTAIGDHRKNHLTEISRLIKEAKCHLVESRMTLLGNEAAWYGMVEGNWNHIAKLESNLNTTAARLACDVQTRRVEETAEPEEQSIAYNVDIVAIDRIGILHDILQFFDERRIVLHDVNTTRYPSTYSGTLLFAAHLVLKIPEDVRIISLRDEFLDFCDQLSLDGILEPIRR